MFTNNLKAASRIFLSGVMGFAGLMHFRDPSPFVQIVPSYLPYPNQLVATSGFFEILGACGLLVPRFRKAAAIGLIMLYIAVFPANINMAINNVPINGHHFPSWQLWIRLLFQPILILWAWWCGVHVSKQRN